MAEMPELDALIHQPTRLRLMMLLSGVKEVDFNFLRNTLGLTNGNLSAQASKLEQAGYVVIEKTFEGKMPNTRYRITDLGRERLAEYWAMMDTIRGEARAEE